MGISCASANLKQGLYCLALLSPSLQATWQASSPRLGAGCQVLGSLAAPSPVVSGPSAVVITPRMMLGTDQPGNQFGAEDRKVRMAVDDRGGDTGARRWLTIACGGEATLHRRPSAAGTPAARPKIKGWIPEQCGTESAVGAARSAFEPTQDAPRDLRSAIPEVAAWRG